MCWNGTAEVEGRRDQNARRLQPADKTHTVEHPVFVGVLPNEAPQAAAQPRAQRTRLDRATGILKRGQTPHTGG